MATFYCYNNSTTTTSGTCTTPLWIWGSGGTGGTATTTATNAWYDDLYSDQRLSEQHREYVQRRQAERHAATEHMAGQVRQSDEAARQERERIKQEHERSEAAKARAHALLLSHLTPAQRQTFETNKWFLVEGGRSKVKYRIRGHTCAGNIEILGSERVTHRLCCHCDPTIPLGDQLLAQKLMLELDEDEFLKLANRRAA
jgi:hypothetical protein